MDPLFSPDIDVLFEFLDRVRGCPRDAFAVARIELRARRVSSQPLRVLAGLVAGMAADPSQPPPESVLRLASAAALDLANGCVATGLILDSTTGSARVELPRTVWVGARDRICEVERGSGAWTTPTQRVAVLLARFCRVVAEGAMPWERQLVKSLLVDPEPHGVLEGTG